MDPAGLLRVIDAVYLVTLAAWAGGLLFALLGALPLARRLADGAEAERLERALWLRCAAWGGAGAALALATLVYGALSVPGLRGPWVGAQAAALLAGLGAMLAVVGAASRRGAGGEAGSLARLRGRATLPCQLAVVLGLGLLAAHGFRPPPDHRPPPSPESLRVQYEQQGLGNIRQSQAMYARYREERIRQLRAAAAAPGATPQPAPE